LRVRNVVQKIGATQLTGDFKYDLSSQETDAKVSALFEPAKRDKISGADPQVSFLWKGQGSSIEPQLETAALESYLSLRAFENSQRRIETLEARVLETQRLQRQIAFAFTREQYRTRKEEERIRLEEEARKQAEAEERERLQLEEEKRLEAARREAERKAKELETAKRKQAERKARERAEAERLERERAENSGRIILQDIDKLLFGLD